MGEEVPGSNGSLWLSVPSSRSLCLTYSREFAFIRGSISPAHVKWALPGIQDGRSQGGPTSATIRGCLSLVTPCPAVVARIDTDTDPDSEEKPKT